MMTRLSVVTISQCIQMSKSLCCALENNTILYVNYTSVHFLNVKMIDLVVKYSCLTWFNPDFPSLMSPRYWFCQAIHSNFLRDCNFMKPTFINT